MLVAIELFLSVHPTWRSTMKSAVAETCDSNVAGCCWSKSWQEALTNTGETRGLRSSGLRSCLLNEFWYLIFPCFSRHDQAGSQPKDIPMFSLIIEGTPSQVAKLWNPEKKTRTGSERPWKTTEIRIVQVEKVAFRIHHNQMLESVLRLYITAGGLMVQKLWVLSLYHMVNMMLYEINIDKWW